MARLSVRTIAVMMAALAAAGCDSGTPPPTTPTPTPSPVTETFSGTLTVNGAVAYNFPVEGAGQITARLLTLNPEDATVGVGLGQWTGLVCNVIIANDQAVMGVAVTGHSSRAGQVCVRIYDVGKIAQPVAFEISVIHP